MFIISVVLRCATTLKLESRPVTAAMTTTVVHSYKLLIIDVKHVHSLTHSLTQSLTHSYCIMFINH